MPLLLQVALPPKREREPHAQFFQDIIPTLQPFPTGRHDGYWADVTISSIAGPQPKIPSARPNRQRVLLALDTGCN